MRRSGSASSICKRRETPAKKPSESARTLWSKADLEKLGFGIGLWVCLRVGVGVRVSAHPAKLKQVSISVGHTARMKRGSTVQGVGGLWEWGGSEALR